MINNLNKYHAYYQNDIRMQMISFPKNVFGAFGVLFIISGVIIPIQNLIVWGPEFVLWFLSSPEFTAEKLSIGVIGLGFVMIVYGKKHDHRLNNNKLF